MMRSFLATAACLAAVFAIDLATNRDAIPLMAYLALGFVASRHPLPSRHWLNSLAITAMLGGLVTSSLLAGDWQAWSVAERLVAVVVVGWLWAWGPRVSDKDRTRSWVDSPESGFDTNSSDAKSRTLMERIKAANILEEDGLEYASRILGEEQISSGSGITRLERAGLLSNHQAKLLRCNEDNRLRFGDFVLLEKIGKGGGGFVFRARRIGSAQFVALKVLARPQQRQRFEREMRIVKKLSHPHIVVAYDVGYARQSMFISMELINGPNLSTIVRESGPITPTKAFHYALQAASALEHAHARGLIHRDVKPGNLMVCGNDLIKLADLGLARLLEADGSSSDYETDVGQLGGTIEFMAPEQAISLSDADERSDIYALGATLYFMLAGRTLLKGETFNEKVQNLTNYKRFHRISDLNLPQAELSILRRMVAYEPENRFASCHDLIDAIKSIQGGQETTGAVTIRLLVVEDNRVDFMATLRYLGKINKSIETHHADSLADAEVRFREDGPFDLVLLDLNLPDSRGPNTVQSFRDGTNTRIPLIVLTGLRDPNIDSQALAAGANSILSKDQLNAETLERHIFVTLSQHAAAH